ncbi:MAG: CdaR family protein, partial [Clostridia bacterium]|nr:CdaR family protein [Clostridia bacterium]
LNKLFYNNKFVALFSVASSIIIWVVMSFSDTQSTPITINDIPVNIALSDAAIEDGLQIFKGKDISASVEISGSRFVVGQVTKNDIQVFTPQSASTITSPGNYTLELSAKKIERVGAFQNYEIVSDVKPSVVTVMVDRYREAEFTIEPEINFTPKSNFYVGATNLSEQKIILSGPESEISKVKKVKVSANLPGKTDSTISLKLPIDLYDAYDKKIMSETISTSIKEVEVNIPILAKKEVSVIANFENVPYNLDLSKSLVNVSPAKLEIAGPEDTIKNLKTINLDKINLNDVSLQNSNFELPINLPQNCKSLTGVYTAKINFDLSQFKEKNITINKISFKNVPIGKKASVYDNTINVKIIAPANEINNIKSSDITAEIDFYEKTDVTTSVQMPVKFSIHNFKCWVCGEHFVNVRLD